jgi:uncharacterized membrane protein
MLLAILIFSAQNRLWLTATAFVAILVAVWWSYRSGPQSAVRWGCGALKILGVAALCACLLEPLWSGQRARPGANLLAILADNSQSLQIRDSGDTGSRGDALRALFSPQRRQWQAALEDNYDVRRFYFDTRLQSTRDLGELTFDGRSTALGSALRGLKERFDGRPLAGILLVTDGNATDLASASPDLAGLPPIYPVVIGRRSAICDTAIGRVTVNQTAFEDAPVTIEADVTALGVAGENVLAQLFDSTGGKVLEVSQRARKAEDTLAFRLQCRPEKPGVTFYRLRVGLKAELGGTNASPASREVSLVNNTRLVPVDRGQGQHRVLYVAGRPNWEYKFLNRAIQEDEQVQLVGLIRVARREAKFDFRGRGGESSNPLFRGFGNQSREDTERYDQPVLSRLNTRDELELRAGFPSTPEDLYRYEAVILDDVEAAFFTADQAVLLQKFVSERGGSLLMLGGMECFEQGNYERTPIGEMLPVYLDHAGRTSAPGQVRLNLEREGWLQPWARLRENESDEKARLQSMPLFQVMNGTREIKPGASIIATAVDERGQSHPALATQRFGRGRTAACTIGDLWRWGMVNQKTHRDLDKFWRQLVRWLVADTPRSVELTAEPGESDQMVRLQVRARDNKFQPLDDATVFIEVQQLANATTNSGSSSLRLRAEPSPEEPGLYEAAYVPGGTGGYLARAAVTNALGADAGWAETGWTTDLAAEEFRSLQPNVGLLQEIARRTGGEVISPEHLEQFARHLPTRKAPVMEAWTTPAWHTPAVLGFALVCLAGEWGLRRWKGMP